MSDETDMLTIQNRALERENRRLRKALRDEFAMAALKGIAAHHIPDHLGVESAAKWAYRTADAMLEARKEPV